MLSAAGQGRVSENRATARQKYRTFVADGLLKQEQRWRKRVGQIFLSSEKFIIRIQALLDDKQRVKEIPRIQRYPGRPALSRLFTDIPDSDKLIRNEKIVEAHLTYGYNPKRNQGLSRCTLHNGQQGGAR